MREIHEEHGSDCTCGCHDHHDHGHDRHHGHNHSHDRDHDHDHDHGHSRDHGRDHGHDHEGPHGRTVEFGWGVADLESHTHDQAATVSVTIHAQPNTGKAFEALVGAMREVAQQVESTGGIVGHIKAYARAGASFAHASSTDAQPPPACEGDVQMALGPDVDCQLVAIALLIDLGQLERIVVAALS